MTQPATTYHDPFARTGTECRECGYPIPFGKKRGMCDPCRMAAVREQKAARTEQKCLTPECGATVKATIGAHCDACQRKTRLARSSTDAGLMAAWNAASRVINRRGSAWWWR